MGLQPHYIEKKEMIEINEQTTTKVKYPGKIGGIEVYLYVAFDDNWGAWNDVNMGFSGCGTSYRRIKKIKLTEEQIKQLQPRQVGEIGGKPLYENVSVLCLQEE